MTDIFAKVLESSDFGEEYFIAEVQTYLSEMMEEKGMTRAELARKLGVSRPRVTQMFSDEARNFTLRLLFRSFAALNEHPVLISQSDLTKQRKSDRGSARKSDQRRQAFPDGLSEELVARLLRATLSDPDKPQERGPRAQDSAQKKWASGGSNILHFRSASSA
jgi:transcriptional regulator with XRE-family HTH domain